MDLAGDKTCYEDSSVEIELPNLLMYQEREKLKNIYIIVIITFIMLIVCIRLLFFKDSFKEKIFPTTYLDIIKEVLFMWIAAFLMFALAALLFRLNVFLTELHFLNNKYNGVSTKVFTATWSFNTLSIIAIVISLICFVIFCCISDSIWSYPWSLDPIAVVLVLVQMTLFTTLIKLNESPSSELWNTNDLRSGIDYGTGMAHSYYQGYLKIILLPDGVENPGIFAKMKQYESQEGVQIPVKKLFILIPESGYIPPNLETASNDWLEQTKNLESEVRDRAGTRTRIYKNTIYKIHPDGREMNHRKVYLAVEGATPMLTLYEILKHSHDDIAAFRDNRHDLIATFYWTLKKLLDSSPDTRNTCELIYYKDYDSDGKQVNIAKILLAIIRKEAPLC